MKSINILIAIFLLATASLPAHAVDGRQLLDQCKVLVSAEQGNLSSGDPINTAYGGGFCTGFVQGILYTSIVYERRPRTESGRVCVPETLTNFQAAKVVVEYLSDQKENFPEMLDLDANTLAITALHSAFACTKAGR